MTYQYRKAIPIHYVTKVVSIFSLMASITDAFTNAPQSRMNPSSPALLLNPPIKALPLSYPKAFKNNHVKLSSLETKQMKTSTRKNASSTALHLSLKEPIASLSSLTSFLPPSLQAPARAVGINFVLFSILRSKLFKVLTPQGMISAFILGSGLWMSTLHWKAWTLCVLYLFFGSAVTKIKFEEKDRLGIAEGRGGRRGPENVWGSAFTGLICCLLATLTASTNTKLSTIFSLAYVTSIATKLSDTFASEIGKAYGKTTFLITTLQKVPAGTEGAVSLEGTLAALLGAAILPLYAILIDLFPTNNVSTAWKVTGFGIATISAFLATFAESWIGAEIQGKKGFEWMTNEVVNFFNTLIGASLSVCGAFLLRWNV